MPHPSLLESTAKHPQRASVYSANLPFPPPKKKKKNEQEKKRMRKRTRAVDLKSGAEFLDASAVILLPAKQFPKVPEGQEL